MLNKIYHVEPKLKGSKVELWETLNRLEVRKGKKIYHLIEEYWKQKITVMKS